MELNTAMVEKVDCLVAVKQAIEHLKQEQSKLEGELLLQGQKDLRDTKFKTVRDRKSVV